MKLEDLLVEPPAFAKEALYLRPRVKRAFAFALAAVGFSTAFHDSPSIDRIMRGQKPSAPLSSAAAVAVAAEPTSVEPFDRDAILSDHQVRVSEQFKVPANLRDRVGFWFDIYSKYDSEKKVIHHGLYPWIVFEVIDIGPIVHAETPRRRWMRNEKADKHVKGELNRWRRALIGLARSGSPRTEDERSVAAVLSPLRGTLKNKAAMALREIRIQTGQKDFFVEGLHLSHDLLPKMEEIFRAHKLPIELTRLPFVESSFKDHATSKIGAKGIWQFTETTGKIFMRVDTHIDERRSPLKSTVGAAKLLKENHMILGRSWPLAISAWNHGPGGIRKASKAAGSRDLAVIISKYRSKSFDFASSNFYAEFLAALHVQKYELEIFGDLQKVAGPDLHPFVLPRRARIMDLVKSSGLTHEEFFRLNPDLTKAARANMHLPKGFRVHVPADSRSGLERLFASSNRETPKRPS